MTEDIAARVSDIAEANKDRFIGYLMHLHRHPEISLREYETTKYIKNIMSELGIPLHGSQPETGAVFLLQGAEPGPCVALRADIDALEITEQSSCPFPSQNEGAMHACGHDVHTSSLLGAAVILSQLRDQLKGSVKFIFQPAEEINMGARKLIPMGVLEDPHVDAIFGLHTYAFLKTGEIGLLRGPIMASVDDLNVTVRGKGGHGGIPHHAADPVVASAAVIQALQSIVSRNVSPVDSGVVTIATVLAGGEKINNIIPDKVLLKGTIRAYREDTRRMMQDRARRICESTAAAYGCEAEVEIIQHLPVTDNRPDDGRRDLYDIALRAAQVSGFEIRSPEPSGGGDDFSLYQQGTEGHPGTAGFYYWLGVGNEEKDCRYSWHSPMYQADPDAVPLGAKLYAMSVLMTSEELTN